MSSRFTMLSVAGVVAAAVLVLPPRTAARQASQVGTSGAAAAPAPQASEPDIVALPTTRLSSGDVPSRRQRRSIPLGP